MSTSNSPTTPAGPTTVFGVSTASTTFSTSFLSALAASSTAGSTLSRPRPTAPGTASYSVPVVFRDPEADICILSSDTVEFRVYRTFLAVASTVFRDMFEHPRPSGAAEDGPVPWPEPAAVIDRLLHYILVRATDKWQIDVALSMLKSELLSSRFLWAHPFKVYAFACQMGFKKERDEAARVVTHGAN